MEFFFFIFTFFYVINIKRKNKLFIENYMKNSNPVQYYKTVFFWYLLLMTLSSFLLTLSTFMQTYTVVKIQNLIRESAEINIIYSKLNFYFTALYDVSWSIYFIIIPIIRCIEIYKIRKGNNKKSIEFV